MKERHGMDGVTTTTHDPMAQTAEMHENLALRLTLEAMRNGQRAAVGILALPATLALGVAATVSYAAAFLERGFETFERSLARIAEDAQLVTEHRVHDRPLFGGAPDSNEQLTKPPARS